MSPLQQAVAVGVDEAEGRLELRGPDGQAAGLEHDRRAVIVMLYRCFVAGAGKAPRASRDRRRAVAVGRRVSSSCAGQPTVLLC